MNHKRSFNLVVTLALAVTLLTGMLGVWPARSAVPHLGYGFNVAAWDTARLSAMGFNWIKVFEAPTSPLDKYVLLRIEVTQATSSSALLADLDAKLAYKDYIDAWEVGNEPNIDAEYGWAAAPDPIAYKDMLCQAYQKIKSVDPETIVVSAGLAPVGRVTGSFNGHPGHDGAKQDEREFLKEVLDNGGGACLDVVGYHPYGYSADYAAVPDVASSDPTQNCDQGLCFRGAEKIYEIMQLKGLGGKKLWATEFGWIVQPPDDCLNDPSWAGRAWQIVTEEKQASNLAGAFQYADDHWPWMGAMFVFNLNFAQNPALAECDQMRYYSVQGRAAETMLTDLSKNAANIPGRLKTDASPVTLMIGVDEQPITLTAAIGLSNWGWRPVTYTASADNGAPLVPTLINPTGTLSGTGRLPLNFIITSSAQAVGVYTALVTVNWTAYEVSNPAPRSVGIELQIVTDVQRIYLPSVTR
ncbi:MAG TPA: hypothetical protein VLG46_12830 [Anaerolineae bacterium]|nr:hypothetical protein [Anaerolineae bacterium]